MAGDIVAVVFDSDFSISDSESSRQEDGEDIYADMGDTAIERQRTCEETRCLTVKKNASGGMLQCSRHQKGLKISCTTYQHRIL